MRSQEKEAESQKDIEPLKKDKERLIEVNTKGIRVLKKEQDRLIVEKSKLWDNRVCLENVVSVAC